MPLGMQVGLSPGDFVLDGDPAPLPKKGGAFQFSAYVYYNQTAGCIKLPLSTQLGLGPGDFMLHGDPPPLPQKGGGAPLPNFPPMSIVAIRLDGSRCHLVRGRLQPRRLCSMGTQLPLPNKGAEPPPIFLPISIVVNRLYGSRWHLAWRWASVQATLCKMGISSTSPLKGAEAPNFQPISIVAKRQDESRCHLVPR